ncbi:hypothetical protein HYY72_05045 [Candidatus Woesearchaeota archaeon]|nr:hypothetical protein [Candidatus Woesearchaeota archaeon]
MKPEGISDLAREAVNRCANRIKSSLEDLVEFASKHTIATGIAIAPITGYAFYKGMEFYLLSAFDISSQLLHREVGLPLLISSGLFGLYAGAVPFIASKKSHKISIQMSIDGFLEKATENYSLASLVAAPFGGITLYKFAEFLGRNFYGIPYYALHSELEKFLLFSALLGAFCSGAGTYIFLRERYHLKEAGFDLDKILKNSEHLLKNVERGKLAKLWNSVFDHPALMSMLTGGYYILFKDQGLLGAAFPSALTWFGLKVSKGVLHSDTISTILEHFYARLEAFVEENPEVYFTEMERVAENSPFSTPRIMLMQEYFKMGRVKEALQHVRILNSRGLFFPQSENMRLLNNPITSLAVEHYRKIIGPNPNPVSYLVLTSLSAISGSPDATRFTDKLVERYNTAENNLLSYWTLNGLGRENEAQRYLGNALSMIFSNPLEYRTAPLGENEPSNVVLKIKHPSLESFFVIRPGDLSRLRIQYERELEARAAVSGHGRYTAHEPLFAGTVCYTGSSGNPETADIYLMEQLNGKTLLEALKDGTAGFDDMLIAWELRRILHKRFGAEPDMLNPVPVDRKIRDSLSRGYLEWIPDNVKALLMECVAPIQHYVPMSKRVVNLDSHPENMMVCRDGKMAAIDLEEKGDTWEAAEAANLWYYYPHQGLKAREGEFFSYTGMDGIVVRHGGLYRQIPLFSAWMNPGRPRMNQLAAGKIGEAIALLDEIRFAYPVSYLDFKPDYEMFREGLERTADMLAERALRV